MSTPSDQRIEERLAALGAGSPGGAPASFMGAVRARRRRVVARRAGVVGAFAIVLAAATAILVRPGAKPVAPGDIRPRVAEGTDETPAAEPGSMLALRRAWTEDGGSGAWLAAFQEPDPAPEKPLRLGDLERVLQGL